MTRDQPRVNDDDLQRFVDAQEPVFEDVLSELREGHKRGHWMWFIFPQLKGLGRSSFSEKFGISSREEAQAYITHPALGPRLRQCSQLVNLIRGRSITEIFGHVDALKFRSSMTLFAHATSENEVFMKALQTYYDGEFDALTVERFD
jgi:uncharacterized protein (DUF1810 family)